MKHVCGDNFFYFFGLFKGAYARHIRKVEAHNITIVELSMYSTSCALIFFNVSSKESIRPASKMHCKRIMGLRYRVKSDRRIEFINFLFFTKWRHKKLNFRTFLSTNNKKKRLQIKTFKKAFDKYKYLTTQGP